MNARRLDTMLVLFVAWVMSLFCAGGNAEAAPADWIRSDSGLTLTSSSSYAPKLFTFDGKVYAQSPTGTSGTVLYVETYDNWPSPGWQQVLLSAGTLYFNPVGNYLYAYADYPALWWWPPGGACQPGALNCVTPVTSTGVPTGAVIVPFAEFGGQLYAGVMSTPGTFDIYRTPDIGKTSMAWTQVVSAGFGDPENHGLGTLIAYNNKLVAVTSPTRTSLFGDCSGFGHGIQVWESPTGNPNTWTQVNQNGFGTQAASNSPSCTPMIYTNQDFGSAAVYNGYLYVGTLAHTWHSGEVWRYNGNGLSGWTNVTPDGMCAFTSFGGCPGPSRANAMVVYNNLLYLGEGVSTGSLETYDGTNWTVVVDSVNGDPIMKHPFDAASRGISSLAVLPSPAGDKLFALTTTLGGAEIWSYPFRRIDDFDGDNKSDILWQHASGAVGIWLMNGATISSMGVAGAVPTNWQIKGVGDFNGDGNSDILWQDTITGTVVISFMNGTAVSSVGVAGAVPPNLNWVIKGVGDFNGDGYADILWQHTSGVVGIWLMNGVTISSMGVAGAVPTNWQIKGIGDFNGDSKSDILWQDTITGTVAISLMNGTSVSSVGVSGAVPTGLGWQIQGVGDFNGDSKSDILWQHTSGAAAIWLMNGATISSMGVAGAVPTNWQIKGVGDFNGDSKSDILWQDTITGTVVISFMNGTSVSSVGVAGAVPPGLGWQIMNK